MKINEKQKFDILKRELASYIPVLGQAADRIIDNEISSYPIFIVHQQEVQLGIELVDMNKVEGNWSVNASTVEEFVQKGLIEEQNLNSFKKAYKDPQKFLCLFSVSELGANFIFLPR